MQTGKVFDRGPPDDLIARFGRDSMEEVFLDMARGRKRSVAELRKAAEPVP
jgi:ABC-2 type transport system ATP-binding protein